MYLLDTDHISLIDRGGPEGQRIRARLGRVSMDEVTASIISFEEQIRGWMAIIARTRTLDRQIPFYRELERLLRFYTVTPLLASNEKAAAEVRQLRQAGIRIGTMDLKIAAIALANDATLLSRNLTDFGKVPDLRVEDWTR
jgi:tRNA(fMet)-specific endonuclease VapC